jgi:diguanylate cyclase (GGDEF)-like protein/PAS domain S-box-containing protein
VSGFAEPSADHGTWEYEIATGSVRWSEAVHRIHGVIPGEFDLAHGTIRELIHPDDRSELDTTFFAAIESGSPFAVQHRVIRPDGAVRTLLVRGCRMDDPEGGEGKMIGTTQDVTGRPGYEERLWHLANEDPLTGLFNRRRLLEELAREVAVAHRTRSVGAVLILDLDRFKEVNDSLGHMAGDMLLSRVAISLKERLRATDTLARLGGDEFAVVLPGCPPHEARRVAAELASSLAENATIRIAGRERRMTASIGIAPFGPRAGETADTLIVEADLAMYRAKREQRGGIELFDEEMRAELAARLETEAELRTALELSQLRVLYQPIASLADGAPVGCEALIRWIHPVRGVVSPMDFIPVAEEYGLIGEIGDFVISQACEQAMAWRRMGRNLYVSVNVSPLQLVRDDIVASVERTLRETRLPPPLLCLEMTETALIDDASAMLPALRGLRRLGVKLAIDDFGGGSSSFGLLRALPLDLIKVDRVFIEGVSERADDRAIVAAVISLAEELALTVIAEGVEEQRQHWELIELGCRYAQGYLYARPAPPQDLNLAGYSLAIPPGVGDPTSIREFMRQIGIPARVGA